MAENARPYSPAAGVCQYKEDHNFDNSSNHVR
jgi:hypothetical protein